MSLRWIIQEVKYKKIQKIISLWLERHSPVPGIFYKGKITLKKKASREITTLYKYF